MISFILLITTNLLLIQTGSSIPETGLISRLKSVPDLYCFFYK